MESMKVRVLQVVLMIAGVLALVPAEAQIDFRAAGAQVTGTGSSLVVTLPAGTQGGDVAILVVAGRPSDTSQPAAPAGWTLRSSALREVGARDLKIVTYYRVLAGGDTNPTLTVPSGWQGGQAGISGQIAVWSGVNPTSPFDVADATGTSAAASPWTPPAVTTATAGARAVSAVASADDNALNLSSAQGFTLRMSGAAYDTTTGGDHSVSVGDKDQATAGVVTMPSWGQTVNASDAWVGITFALKPQGQAQAALYFIHADHLDTPRVITNAAQQVVWRWDSDDPFGNNPPNENPSGLGNFACNLRLPGQYYDKETNLHYNTFRDYDPAIGRYIESDPIGLQGGINTYAYVGGNPLSRIDPTGEFFFVAFFGPTLSAGLADLAVAGGVTWWWQNNVLPGNTASNGGPLSIPDPIEARKRGKSDPYTLPVVNPGRDCNGNCNPCPEGKKWWVNRPGHGHANGYWHELRYNQDPVTCTCYPDRPSRGLTGK